MTAAQRPSVTHWRAVTHGHLRDLARYCGVSVAAVVWWQYAGVPAAHRREVQRFARVITALERRSDSQVARGLLRLTIRAAQERRDLRTWRNRPMRHARYRVIVRSPSL